jgi:phosphoglycolate phosphatase-like HAD superfamily hydrolase
MEHPGGISAVILDFDGVIVESVDIKTGAFRELFSIYPDRVDEIVAYHLAHNAASRYEKFRVFYRDILHLPYDDETERRLDRELSSIVFSRVVSCPFVPGAEEFLRTFSGKVPMFLVSATPLPELERILEKRGIRRCFTAVYGAPGSKEDQIGEILAKEGFRRDCVVYVGDMQEDVRVARALGIPFVGREQKEPLAGLGVPAYPDMRGVRGWILSRGGPCPPMPGRGRT